MNKSLVSFFTVLLIVISLFQLSFTYFVNQHEDTQMEVAQKWVKSTYPLAAQKYGANTQLTKLYQDTLDTYLSNRYQQLLSETKDQVITYGLQGGISYQKAKEAELNLGLDLQGGLNVTLEIKFEDFLSSQVINPDDISFQTALKNAVQKRYETNRDFIDVFVDEYKKVNANASLLSIINLNNFETLPDEPTEDDVIRILKSSAKLAMTNTFNILTKRIDQFGVAQPNINLDQDKGIITVELAGVSNLERVKKYLQSSANLEFFEVYTINEIGNSLMDADKFMADKLSIRTTTKDTNTAASAQKDTAVGLAALARSAGTTDALSNQQGATGLNTKNPILSLLIQSPNPKNPEFAFVPEKNKVLLEEYLQQVKPFFPKNARIAFGLAVKQEKENIYPLYMLRANVHNKAQLEGKSIVNASQDFDPLNPSRAVVNMEMNIEGTRIWRDLTEKNVGKSIAVCLDNVVYTAPTVNGVIAEGRSQISGNFTIEEAQDLAKILKAGKLPVSTAIVQSQEVGPTLGIETIKKGGISFLISFIVIFILMLVYYSTGGWVANAALLLNLLYTVGVLSALGATLTAAGIAGLILTIGMAVDANVIIFERIKEEVHIGNSMPNAIRNGFNRSLAPVLDSHITTLLTAIILYSFGLGAVKGFATTQILGILLSLFCGILFSRLAAEWWVVTKKKDLNFFTPLSKNLFKNVNIRFIENRKYAYIISALVLVGGIASFFNGFHQGVEFAGGRSYTIRFDQKVAPEAVKNDLQLALNGETPIVKTLGEGDRLNITTSYLINENNTTADSVVLRQIFTGLKAQLPQDISFEQFDKSYRLSTSKVLPTISEDLKMGAQLATFWALLLIAVYIFIRFRDWKYSLGTIVALLHDVFVMLMVFSFMKDIVPFSLEIDQHFIAAILTVIGFSMNDTVIVFDRIREYTKLMPTESKAVTLNKAINNTLSRTIMTSLTVLLTVLILFLLGGDVTKGFAFALLIGIITGTYSSIFVAAPILIDLGKKKKKA